MTQGNQQQSFKSSDIEFKINLSKQIDRVAQAFSNPIDSRHTNLRQAQIIQFDNLLTTVDTLECMISPFLDTKYFKELSEIKPMDKDENNIRDIQRFAFDKWHVVMACMHRKQMLMEESEEDIIEEYTPGETEVATEIVG